MSLLRWLVKPASVGQLPENQTQTSSSLKGADALQGRSTSIHIRKLPSTGPGVDVGCCQRKHKGYRNEAWIGGVAAQMEKFNFFFGVELGRKILNMADNLLRTLQTCSALSACEGQSVVKMTKFAVNTIR